MKITHEVVLQCWTAVEMLKDARPGRGSAAKRIEIRETAGVMLQPLFQGRWPKKLQDAKDSLLEALTELA